MAFSSTSLLTAFVAVGAAQVSFTASSARADVVYLTQSREVFARFRDSSIVQSFNAPDFGPFTMTASVSTLFGRADATQNSTLEPSGIVVSGGVGAASMQQMEFLSHSTMDIAFIVTELSAFTFRGSWPSAGITTNQLVRLRENDTVLFEVSGSTLTRPYLATGLLRPGSIYRYEFAVYVDIVGTGIGWGTNYISTLAVPEPAALALAAILGVSHALRRKRLPNDV